MRLWWSFVAVALVGSPAASDVFFCDSTKRGTKDRFITPFFQAPYKPGPELGDTFEDYLAASNPGTYDAGCFSHDSLRAAQSRLDTFKYNNQDYRWIMTDFTGGYPQATDASTVKRPSGAFLTVEKAHSTPAEAADDQAKRDLEALRAVAASKVDIAAHKMRQDAAYQAAMAKFFAEMRKRGNKQ